MKRLALAILGVVVVAAAVGLALGLSGGSGGNGASTSTTTPSPSGSRISSTTTGGSGTGGIRKPLLGIDIWWRNNPKIDNRFYVTAESRNIVKYLVSDLHANAVSLCFPIYTRSLTSETVFANAETPSPSNVGIFVHMAEAAHLSVSLRPLVNVGTLSYGWRGHIHPHNLESFFGSYVTALRPYLQLAERDHVSTVVYASELWDLSIDPSTVSAWSYFVKDLGRYYKGNLAYDSSGRPWYQGRVVVPGFSDYADAYFPVKNAVLSTSEETLYQAWVGHLSPLPAAELHRTVLQEVGFAAIPTGYQRPSTVVSGHTDVTYLPMQKAWFDMVCHVVSHFHLAGVYFWTIYFNSDPLAKTPIALADPTTWVGRPGATAIAACFKSLGSS